MQQLPARPNLTQLKNQAKDLLKQLRAANPEALARFHERHPAGRRSAISLTGAQFVIAREHGFSSWPKLKQHVSGLELLEDRVGRLRAEFAAGDPAARELLLKPTHDRRRFENYNPLADALSDADARLLIANQEGYAYWNKYESYLHLDPAVRDAIAAVRAGDLPGLREILAADPAAANPHWVPRFAPPNPVPNDSVPLFCVAEGIFRKTNTHGNGYELAHALIESGAAVDIAGGLPLTAALSFHAGRVVEALLDSGAAIDGVDGDGVPMAYPLHFADCELAELMAARGAKLDLRFAAGLGRCDLMQSFFHPDGMLKPGAGALADPYGLELKYYQGKSPFRCERTRANILSQALYFACINNRPEAASFLLAQGADVNAIVPGLDSKAAILHHLASLHAAWADAESLWSMIRFLLERGARFDIRDEEHHGTPLGWAQHCKRPDIASLLAEWENTHPQQRI